MSNKTMRKISKSPICGVYQIKNKINGKIYIGQSIDIERRWEQHRYGKGSLILKNAIKKYGLGKFEFSILEEIKFTNKKEIIKLLTELEQKWFDLKKPYLKENGYNQNKTSKPNIPLKKSEDYGDIISRIKIENNHCGKPIIQYDLNGAFIKKWKSAAQVERTLGFKAENISGCCLNKQNSSNNFIWRFADIKLTTKDIKNANKSLRMSKVRQYNLKGKLINTFENIKDASKQTKINESAIRQCCNGHIKTAYNFIWKFKNESLNLLDHITKKDYPIKQLSLDNEIIKEWDNTYLVINELKLSKYSAKLIYQCCDRVKTTYLGYKWEWNL